MHGEKKFQCPQCLKRFCTKGNLNLHIKGKHQAVTQKQYGLSTRKRKVERDEIAAKENETQAAVNSINNYQWQGRHGYY